MNLKYLISYILIHLTSVIEITDCYLVSLFIKLFWLLSLIQLLNYNLYLIILTYFTEIMTFSGSSCSILLDSLDYLLWLITEFNIRIDSIFNELNICKMWYI